MGYVFFRKEHPALSSGCKVILSFGGEVERTEECDACSAARTHDVPNGDG